LGVVSALSGDSRSGPRLGDDSRRQKGYFLTEAITIGSREPQRLPSNSVSTHRLEQPETHLRTEPLRLMPQPGALARDVLEHFDPIILIETALRTMLGGSVDAALISYLAATTRLIELAAGSMPCHVLLKGAPSAGKSANVGAVRRLLPPEAMVIMDAASPHVLMYDDGDLRHKVLFVAEADSISGSEDNPAASAIRGLLTDGHLHYDVVVPERGPMRFSTRSIDRPGPTVMITTATRPLGDQLMSRLLVVDLPEDGAHLRSVLQTQARLEVEGPPPIDPALPAFQAYLQELAPIPVVVPFATEIALGLSNAPIGPQVTRLHAEVLSLIKAVALCRIGHRDLDATGRLTATLDDYRTVRKFAGDTFAKARDDVGRTIRETARAVTELPKLLGPGVPITVDRVATFRGVNKSTASRHVAEAVNEGWLVNRAGKGRPADLRLGNTMQAEAGLPDL
jgi:hypothetical protein